MAWSVEYSDEFGTWWDVLTVAEQESVAMYVKRLIARGPNLPFPYSSGIKMSRHDHMRELRAQSGGRPIRVFYAFDPTRTAILLIGGDKTGNDRFYEEMIPQADQLYDQHIETLIAEGKPKQ